MPRFPRFTGLLPATTRSFGNAAVDDYLGEFEADDPVV
jgi:hypothetical protein